MSDTYELAYRLTNEPNRPILRRGTLAELQPVISDALHYDLDHLELKKTEKYLEQWEIDLLQSNATDKQIEVKQAPINTANHKCWSCGKSIKRVEDKENNTALWIHWGTNQTLCSNQETGQTDYAYPEGQ